MAEYKLSYTASEIDERLGMVDKLSSEIETLRTEIGLEIAEVAALVGGDA